MMTELEELKQVRESIEDTASEHAAEYAYAALELYDAAQKIRCAVALIKEKQDNE